MKIKVQNEADEWVVVDAEFVKADAGWMAEIKDNAEIYIAPIMGFVMYEDPDEPEYFTSRAVGFDFREILFDKIVTPDGEVLDYYHGEASNGIFLAYMKRTVA
jgi:hypothetical protein